MSGPRFNGPRFNGPRFNGLGMHGLATFRLLLVLALRNVAAHRVKSVIVGSILFFGTTLVVAGRALLDSVEASMAQSITSSMAGHLQVYAADARDPLALFGGLTFGASDIGEIPDVGAILGPLSSVPNVKAIVPMGITNTTVFGGNELDIALTALRTAVRSGDTARQAGLVARLKRIVADLREEHGGRAALLGDPAKAAAALADLDRAGSEALWTSFEADPLAVLDFLDNRIAPLTADGRLNYFRVVGTDLESFTSSFDHFYIVDGEPIPPGRRGFLFSKRTWERVVKHKVARELDAIRKEREGGALIASDTLLQERIARNARQYQRILFQLDPDAAARLESALRAQLPGDAGPLDELVQRFLMVNDENFDARYAFFYDVVAPMIRLYEYPIGDVITLRAYTKAGYVRSINVKIYGTYEFRGLENSDLASASNLTDMITFRDLYGKMTTDQHAELAALSAELGGASIARENAEDALFGGGGDIVVEAPVEARGDAPVVVDTKVTTVTLDEHLYSSDEIRNGLALNAAIILKDPDALEQSRADLERVIAENGLNLQVVDWQAAAGLMGQFLLVIRVVLVTAIFIIFLVALVIINNSMVMATMDRVGEIGTMRAIGAQRAWVLTMFLLETLVLGLLAGGAGALTGVAIITWLGSVGVPAVADILVILFAGPRLYPTWGLDDVAFGMGVVVVVGVLSTIYPAIVAARIQPVVAMAGKE